MYVFNVLNLINFLTKYASFIVWSLYDVFFFQTYDMKNYFITLINMINKHSNTIFTF